MGNGDEKTEKNEKTEGNGEKMEERSGKGKTGTE